MKNKIIRRGDVYWVNLDEVFPKLPHYQRGIRPCLIISNNMNNNHCDVVNVIPLTTQIDDLPQHKYIFVNHIKNYVIPEQVTTIHKTLLKGFYGYVNKDMLDITESAMKIQFGMKER